MGLKDFFNSKKPIRLGNPLAPMGDFPLVNVHDIIVDYDDETKKETRLDEKLADIGNGGSVDLTGYATEGYVEEEIADELTKFDANIKTYIDEKMDGFEGGTSEETESRLQALEKWMADENYTKITANLSISPSSKEFGDSATGTRVTWSVSKAAKAITLTLPTGTTVDLTDTTTPYIDTNTYTVTATKTWKLTATEADRGGTASKSASLTCQYRVYWGVGTEASAFDSDFVRSLRAQNSTLTTSRNRSLSFNSIDNQYVYYVIPTALGEPTFQIGEFPVTGGFEAGVAISVDTGFKDANDNPIMLGYKLYRSSNPLSNDEPFKVYIT